MDNVGSLYVAINGDASGLLDALSTAQEGISSFGEIAGGVFAGMGAASLFSDITGGLGEVANFVTGTASDFQAYGQTFTQTLSNLSEQAGSMNDTIAGGNAKAGASALEATDAFITYQEKIQEIEQNIADVMAGQNVIDAQSNLNQKLEDLAQQHADKVESINDQIAQSQQDLLDQ